MKHAQILHWSVFPLVYIAIPEIVYIKFYLWKQQFLIQKQVHMTETLKMQIHSITQAIDTYWLNSSFIQALSLKPWFEIKKCFHSVPSFAIIVFGLSKQVSTFKLSFMLKVNMLQWNNWSDRWTLVLLNVFDVCFSSLLHVSVMRVRKSWLHSSGM